VETLGAVVVGAVITGLASYAVASQQTQATNEEALRTQRVNVYTQFMADSEELDHAHVQFVELVIKNPSRHSKEAIAAIKKPVDDAMSKVSKDVSMVSLIGSPRAATIANRMMTIDYEHHQVVILIEHGVIIEVPDDAYSEAKRLLVQSIDNKERNDLLEQFTLQAREDVSQK
jgi:hypothetical protein